MDAIVNYFTKQKNPPLRVLFIELIQPISGKSIFKDYIDNNPTGGVQHIAYSTPIANLDK